MKNMIDEKVSKNGFPSVRLGDVALVFRGTSPRPVKNYLTDNPDGENWIKISDASENDRFITSTAERITKDGALKSKYVSPGDLILSLSMNYGRPYLLKIDGFIYDGWAAIRGYEDYFVPEYLYYLLKSNSVQSQFDKKAGKGGPIANITLDDVKDLVLPVPTKENQRLIVKKLDLFSDTVFDLINQLELEINLRKIQYEFYRDKLLMVNELET